MFAVYRVDGDGCTYSYDTLLFVTASEQTAEDTVALAELELEAALAVPRCSYNDMQKYGMQWYDDQEKAYFQKLKEIFTVDPPEFFQGHCLGPSKDVSYYYEKVEVR